MGKVTYIPTNHKDTIDIIQVSKDKVKINGIEYQSIDIEEFFNSLDITPEAEERFVRGLFEIIKKECIENWRVLKIFREIFTSKK